jgi:hypothetical protein
MYINSSTKSLILLCFFPFSFSLNPYERNVRRTSTPQGRRQRAQHCNRTLQHAIFSRMRWRPSVKREETKRKHEKEKKEREREKRMRRSEVKREGTRALCFILIYVVSALGKHRLIHKHGHQYWQRPERQPRCDLLHHIERSVQMIKHNQSRRSSVLTHASFSFHRDIHICSFIFLSTLLLRFVSFIVCRYVHIECTDERKSKVHWYSQRLGAETEMSER